MSLLLHLKGTIAMPGVSDSKEYAFNAGDLGSIPGLGNSSGEREMATHSSILAWRIPWAEGAWRTMVHEITDSDTTERLTLSFTGIRTPHGCKLKLLLFERAQSENLEEVRLSLDVDENNGSARTLDRTREP